MRRVIQFDSDLTLCIWPIWSILALFLRHLSPRVLLRLDCTKANIEDLYYIYKTVK